MHKAILALLLFVGLSTSAQTNEMWSLQKCIDYALEHNTTIQQGELQGDILENNLNQAKMSRLPTLNGSGNHNYNIGRTIDPFTNTFSTTTIQSNSFSLSGGILLYGGSQVNNRIKQGEVAHDANDKSTDAMRNQIALSVATTYLQIIQAEENLKIAEAQKELTQTQLERAKKLEESGAANQSNYLMLQAQAASDQVAIVNAQNAIQIGYNTLMNLMQYPLDTPLKIQPMDIATLPETPLENVSEIYTLALSNMPEVQQAELQIAQSMLGEKIAGASLQPTLSAYGNVNTVYSQSGKDYTVTNDFDLVTIGYTKISQEAVLQPQPIILSQDKTFGNQLADNLGQQVGLSLSVPIFNGYRNRTAWQNAKLNTTISELNLETTKNQLRNDVTTAYTNLKAAKSRYEAAQYNEEAQRLNYNFSQKRFDAGVLNGVDLMTAKNAWNQAQLNLLNAKYEYVFRSLIIDFYKGKQL